MMFMAGAVILGLVLLVAGGEALVRGATALALRLKIPPAVVGLTIVAAGTSMPELVVSVQAALAGSPALAVGNVVGSNIFNIAAILGVAALISPLRVQGNTVRLEWPVMALAAWQLHLLSRDGTLDRLEGAFFLGALVAFTAYLVHVVRRGATEAETQALESVSPQEPDEGEPPLPAALGALLLGVALLVGGAHALVYGASEIARAVGVSEAVIGLTVVAAGTSLPELAASAVAAWKGRDDIAVANVVGSNIFNVLAIAGTTAIIHPLPVPAEIIARDNLWMLAVSLLLLPLMRSDMRISRLEGAVLLAAFITYLGLLMTGAR